MTVAAIASGLADLGLGKGDRVLVTADIRYMRIPRSAGVNPRTYPDVLLAGLLEAVGPEGTVIVLSFTPTGLAIHPGGPPLFTAETPATTGGLVASALAHPECVRSTHPTNSFAAIGHDAEKLMRFHTPASHTHRPLEDLVNYGGKQLVFGCVDSTPGFSTVHLAQIHLGLAHRNLLAGRLAAKHLDPWGHERTFRKRDMPGCSRGFGNLYPVYREAGAMSEGTAVRAPCLLADLPEAYQVAREALLHDPTCVSCDDPDCEDCRYLKTYAHDRSVRVLLRAVRERL